MTHFLAPLRINVGFIVHQSVGYNREFPLEQPEIPFSDDTHFEGLLGKVIISRTTEGLLVQVSGSAQTHVECSLCLEPFTQPLQFDFVEMYTFPSHADQSSELVLADDFHIDLLPLIQEYLYLEMPINPICRPNCKGLCPICGENQNLTTCHHGDESHDPRLEILKTLLEDEPTP